MKNWFYLWQPYRFHRLRFYYILYCIIKPFFFFFVVLLYRGLIICSCHRCVFFCIGFLKYSGSPTVRKIFAKYFIKKKMYIYLPIIYELPFWTLLAIPSIAFPIVPITFEIIEANTLSLKIFSNGDVATRSPFFLYTKLNKRYQSIIFIRQTTRQTNQIDRF